MFSVELAVFFSSTLSPHHNLAFRYFWSVFFTISTRIIGANAFSKSLLITWLRLLQVMLRCHVQVIPLFSCSPNTVRGLKTVHLTWFFVSKIMEFSNSGHRTNKLSSPKLVLLFHQSLMLYYCRIYTVAVSGEKPEAEWKSRRKKNPVGLVIFCAAVCEVQYRSTVLRCNNFPVKCKRRMNSIDDSNLQLNSMTRGWPLQYFFSSFSSQY